MLIINRYCYSGEKKCVENMPIYLDFELILLISVSLNNSHSKNNEIVC